MEPCKNPGEEGCRKHSNVDVATSRGEDYKRSGRFQFLGFEKHFMVRGFEELGVGSEEKRLESLS